MDSELDATIDSPFRAELRDRLLKEVGILVHVPATVEAREDLKPLLNDLESNWDEKEKCGVSLMTLDRNDPEEELLLSFLGVPKEGPDWVAILFGRGKAMDPWTGPEINEPELNGQLESLIGECSCLQTAGALGVDLPMRWTEGMDAMMVPLRDPVEAEDPTVLAGMRNSGLTDGPVRSVLVIAGIILAGGVAILIVRSRRQTGPLATHWGR